MKYLPCLPKDYEQKPSWPLAAFLDSEGDARDFTEDDLNDNQVDGE